MDASSRGRTSRAHVAWLVPAALASTLLLGAVAVASNFNTYTSQSGFYSFVTGPTFSQTFSGITAQAPFFDFQDPVPGSNYAYRVTADVGGTPVLVSLLQTPLPPTIQPFDSSPGNRLTFTNTGSSTISAFGGLFAMRNWESSGNLTSGTMTLTAFDGGGQVFQGSFAVSGTGPSFFGIAADSSNPITRVELTGAATPEFWTVNAEQVIVGVVPVPEPSTLALGGCAVVAIVLARRTKPRKARAVIGVSIAILALHVTSTMADSTVTSRPPDTTVVQGVDGRPAAPPMEPLVPSVASSL